MSQTQRIVDFQNQVFKPALLKPDNKHQDSYTAPTFNYGIKAPSDNRTKELLQKLLQEYKLNTKSGSHVKHVQLHRAKPLDVATVPLSRHVVKPKPVEIQRVHEGNTEQITLFSSQGEIGYFSPKGPLQKVTVLELKMSVLTTFPTLAHVGAFQLIHHGTPLDVDTAPLSSYGIQSWSLVQIEKKKVQETNMEQITISLSQGEIGYFVTKEPLLKVKVLELKEFIVKKKLSKYASCVNDVKLTYEGKPLDDNTAPLSSYGIKPQDKVQMMIMVHGG